MDWFERAQERSAARKWLERELNAGDTLCIVAYEENGKTRIQIQIDVPGKGAFIGGFVSKMLGKRYSKINGSLAVSGDVEGYIQGLVNELSCALFGKLDQLKIKRQIEKVRVEQWNSLIQLDRKSRRHLLKTGTKNRI